MERVRERGSGGWGDVEREKEQKGGRERGVQRSPQQTRTQRGGPWVNPKWPPFGTIVHYAVLQKPFGQTVCHMEGTYMGTRAPSGI